MWSSRFGRGVRLCWSMTVAQAPWITSAALALNVIGSVLGPLGALFIARLTQAAIVRDAHAAVAWGVAFGMSVALTRWVFQASWIIGEPSFQPSARKGEQILMGLVAELPGLEHLERPEYLDRLNVLRQERAILLGIHKTLTFAIGAVIQMALTVGLLATVHPLLVLLALVGLPQLWIARRSDAISRTTAEASAPGQRLSRHFTELLTTAAPGRELRVMGALDAMLGRDRALTRDLARREIAGRARAQAVGAAGSILVTAGYLAAIGFALYRAVSGRASAGSVVLTIVLAQQVNWTVGNAVSSLSQVMEGARVTGRYLWFMDYVENDRRRLHARRADAPATPVPSVLRDGIRLTDVTFTYPGRSRPALDGVTAHLSAGSTVALVGENGAGKSTLVKLLARMYEPDRGSILVDGISLDDFDADVWRRHVTAAFQDFGRFEFLVRETVGVGGLDWPRDGELVGTALRQCGASTWVSRLPSGEDTQLGVTWPGGVELSGGQWQTLAIARSEMRPHPLLLLLDEPTAALDPFAEAGVFERYSSSGRRSADTRGGIALLVSHRFSTVRTADLILVIDGGRLIEQGSHEELMDAGGWYADAFATQAKGYR